LGIIPGPHEPKHLNSFLHPFYLECVQGAKGIPAVRTDGASFKSFDLHFYPLFGIGDIKALIKLCGTKGPNALAPCHLCTITGVRDPNRVGVTTHYLPHIEPGETVSRLPHLLSQPRTHQHYLRTYHQLDRATT
ncbi:hypothetical protein CPB86DRAFT_694358, partial [Serendipita vermifera]